MDPNVALLLLIYFYVFSFFFFYVQNVLTIDGKHSALGGMV